MDKWILNILGKGLGWDVTARVLDGKEEIQEEEQIWGGSKQKR